MKNIAIIPNRYLSAVFGVYYIFSPGKRVLLFFYFSQVCGKSLILGTNLFIKNFNVKYGENLILEQKTLLNKYISSFADNGTELRVFLNEEITRLRTILTNSLAVLEIQEDELMFEKTQKVLEILETTSTRPVDAPFIQDILKIQNLVKEIIR